MILIQEMDKSVITALKMGSVMEQLENVNVIVSTKVMIVA